ncbi:MAG: NUDIX hydrolase [Candidatus Spechtbacterales bacterium]
MSELQRASVPKSAPTDLDKLEEVLSKYDVWTSAVFAPSWDNKLPLVRELEWNIPEWKLPGGKSEPGETPQETAVREFKEETGLIILQDRLQLIAYEERDWYKTSHMFFIFSPPLLSSFEGLRKRGIEGEEVGVFEWNPMSGDFTDLPRSEFLDTHMRVLQDFNIFSRHSAAA